uniref:Collagenase 3 n=1 Tax=Seriola dumerili TaxID=41447 RepID=A0A3B4UJS6_SERDU
MNIDLTLLSQQGYLRRFYNLNPRSRDRVSVRRIRSTSAMEEKIREMQNFFGLTETWTLIPWINMHSFLIHTLIILVFADYCNIVKWSFSRMLLVHLLPAHRIAKYTPDMKRGHVARSFCSALKMWSAAAPLRFIKVSHGKADIVFSFARRTHGDFSPFDGPRGVLAHAFQPGEGMGGDVYFDEDETWTAGGQGFLFAVAAHELGHSLGLTHSKDPSLLFAQKPRKPTTKLETQPALKRCDSNSSFDAAAMIGKEIVFFKNRYMWMRMTGTSCWSRLREGRSSTYLPSISSHVDAAYDIPAKGVAYIFTGRVMGSLSCAGSIYEYGFSSRIRQVDAAVHVSEYGKTVFFTGEFYYRYDERMRRMDPGFPRLIQTDWPGIPKRVNAAFNIFLLSGLKSYQFDFRQKRVLNIIPANSWLGCRYS